MKHTMLNGRRFMSRRKTSLYAGPKAEKPKGRVIGDADASAKAAAETKRERRRGRNLDTVAAGGSRSRP